MPNLQGLWAGTWSAPWFATFTVNGNLPCAISFFCRGNTPEFNESLLKWIEARLPEMRDAAKRHFGARGFRAAAQTTVAGVETDSNANYPHVHFLPAKPKEWKSGSIKGLLLRGGIVLENLEWRGEDFSAKLRLPNGDVRNIKSVQRGARQEPSVIPRWVIDADKAM